MMRAFPEIPEVLYEPLTKGKQPTITVKAIVALLIAWFDNVEGDQLDSLVLCIAPVNQSLSKKVSEGQSVTDDVSLTEYQTLISELPQIAPTHKAALLSQLKRILSDRLKKDDMDCLLVLAWSKNMTSNASLLSLLGEDNLSYQTGQFVDMWFEQQSQAGSDNPNEILASLREALYFHVRRADIAKSLPNPAAVTLSVAVPSSSPQSLASTTSNNDDNSTMPSFSDNSENSSVSAETDGPKSKKPMS